jgi:hypothetical protein
VVRRNRTRKAAQRHLEQALIAVQLGELFRKRAA